MGEFMRHFLVFLLAGVFLAACSGGETADMGASPDEAGSEVDARARAEAKARAEAEETRRESGSAEIAARAEAERRRLEEENKAEQTTTVTVMTNGQASVKRPTKTVEIVATLPLPDDQTDAEANNAEFDFGDSGIVTAKGESMGTGGVGIAGAGAGAASGNLGLGGYGTNGGGSGSGYVGSSSGAGPKTPPTSAQLKQRKMRQMLRDLKTYPIAYETPDVAIQSTAFNVTLAIDASGDDSAVEGLPQKHNITENVARLSERVQAKLSGAAFAIKSSNAGTQMLLPHRETVWRWSVEPLQAGDHDLYLEIFANVGEDDAIMLESFQDLITVDVAPSANKPRLIDDMRIYISVIGGLISLILGLIALSGHIKNKRAAADDV